MKKYFGILVLLIGTAVMLFTSGCAQTCQRMKANGSVIGTVSGSWVVEKMSGGVITDVYKLEDALVKSEEGSDGWLFLDQNGNPVHLGGDMKAIRCTNDKQEVFDKYVEFHMDLDLCTYAEKYRSVKKVDTGYLEGHE
jgi:hypothetical protein